MYGMMYGMTDMKKTTIYLPERLRKDLKAAAEHDGRSEAAIIREALEIGLGTYRTKPNLPLFEDDWGDPTLAERVDELLEQGRFGEDPPFEP